MKYTPTHAILCSITLALSGCGIDKALDDFGNRLSEFGFDVENGAIGLGSIGWQLKALLDHAPKELSSELRASLSAVADRVAQDAGIQTRSTMDFARRRIAGDLRYFGQALRAAARGQAPPPEPVHPPQVCLPSPASLRRDKIQEHPVVAWDGYDLCDPNGRAVVSAALARRSGGQTVYEPLDILSSGSAYLLIADLSRVSNRITKETTQLVLLYNDHPISEVGIVDLPPPTTYPLNVPLATWKCVATKCTGPAHPPMNPHADTDFKGNTPRIDYRIRIAISDDGKTESQSGKQLIALISYHAIEWDTGKHRAFPDFTEACGDWTLIVYAAPTGSRIVGIGSSTTVAGIEIQTQCGQVITVRSPIYPTLQLQADGDGPDVGVFTTIEAPVQGSATITLEKPAP